MDIFVVLPDQLFASVDVIEELFLCEYVYLAEDPLYFCKNKEGNIDTSNRRNIMILAAIKSYKRYLRGIFKKFARHNKLDIRRPKKLPIIKRIKYGDILAKGPDIFDYLAGHRGRINMWRIANIYEYGDKPWDVKVYGINVNFYESPAFLVNYRTIFNKYKRGQSSRPNKKNFCVKLAEQLGIDISDLDVPPELPLDLQINYDLPTVSSAPITHETAEYILARFLDAHMGNYDYNKHVYLLAPMNLGLLTPDYVIDRAIMAWGRTYFTKKLIFDIMAREYRRLIYLLEDKSRRDLRDVCGSLYAQYWGA